MSDFITTLEILEAVETFIGGLQVDDASGPLFEAVKLYDANDVDRAFADLFLARQKRLCFILPGRDSYVKKLDGRKFMTEKRTGFGLLICDTDRKTGQDAVFGGPNNIGVIGLKDRVVEQITGNQLGLRWVIVEPDEGDTISVYKDGDTDAGRKGWFQLFETRAGTKTVGLSL